VREQKEHAAEAYVRGDRAGLRATAGTKHSQRTAVRLSTEVINEEKHRLKGTPVRVMVPKEAPHRGPPELLKLKKETQQRSKARSQNSGRDGRVRQDRKKISMAALSGRKSVEDY